MQQLIHSIITISVVLFFFILSAVSSLAGGVGKEVCDPYKPLVVQITTQFSSGEESGFGFIVGERYDQFYIVTANHVVRRDSPDNITKKVLLHFSWDPGGKGYTAELLYTMYGPLDLALLRIDKTKINGAERISWEGRKWCRRWQREEEAWFIGRERKWYIPPDGRAGILVRTEPDLRGFVQIDINTVQPGTSGAPLFIKNGLIGMIISDSPGATQAVHIDYIRRFVSIENPYPWNIARYDSDQGDGKMKTNKPSSRHGEVKKQRELIRPFRGSVLQKRLWENR
ncbi:Trypsin-like peptidase domain-containing protein [Candidatus Electrothrix aarhusensis]|uniref:Trypsin-like peptidase domain-containing protein n=1 Tax=Candidatus Electrothrix aarhusensis TaxID=1859131 RepID=A0A3S3QK80_9BACT|nr:Trypsin-like peptidase domain-containing protein [Candidatus Electrothrix aarhusensis]